MNNYTLLEKIILDEKIIDETQLKTANERKDVMDHNLIHAILDLQYATETQLLVAIGNKLGFEFLEALVFNVDADTLKLIPEAVARQYVICPIGVESGSFVIAVCDPFNYQCFEDINMITGRDVIIKLATQSEIEKALSRLYSFQNETEETDTLLSDSDRANKQRENEIMSRVDSAPIVRMVNNLITEAYKHEASDIHIEPYEEQSVVRFRINGDLLEYVVFTADFHPLVTTRIKIIASMNIAEKRIPQDGAFKMNINLNTVDFRVSSLPTTYGEKIVIRLLGSKDDNIRSFHDSTVNPRIVEDINRAIKFPNGIILVTGPTGSGKTTTLYSMINQLSSPQKSIVTVEDPVERKIDGITQVNINERSGLTFARGLRSILRQDPDIIMVGEIRDSETAEIAIRAAITGHLVLSTLHTNDAISTVLRLVDMGVAPYMVASSVKYVIAQRLVKHICPHCREERPIRYEDQLLMRDETIHTVFFGKGCEKCNYTGYIGRVAVFEVLSIDKTLQRMISENAPRPDFQEYVTNKHIRLLEDEVRDLVRHGETSVEEAEKIIFSVE